MKGILRNEPWLFIGRLHGDRARNSHRVRLALHLSVYCCTHLGRDHYYDSVYLFQNMELSRAKHLVHIDVALAQFRRDRNIQDDIFIEKSGPNKVVAIVQGEGNCILVRMWLIH